MYRAIKVIYTTDRQSDQSRETEGQTTDDRQTERQTHRGRQTDRQAEKQIDRQTTTGDT